MQNQNGKKAGLSTTQIILIVGIAIVAIAVIAVGIFVMQKLNTPNTVTAERRPSGQGTVITESNIDQATPKTPESFTTKMNTIWTFPDSSSPSTDAVVGNNKANQYPFFFEVYLEDTQQLVYTSPEIPVGADLKEMTLDYPLKKGTYTATCDYNLLDDNKDIIATVSFTVTLEVAS